MDVILQSMFKLNDEILRYKYYSKRITTRDNGNVQYHNQEESKLTSTINVNSGAHTIPDDKMISPFKKNNVATIKYYICSSKV